MDANELDQVKRLEAEILSRELSPAKPVGLRYDRLAREGWLPVPRSATGADRPSAAHAAATASGLASAAGSPALAYWACNCLSVANLLKGYRRVLTVCEEHWVEEALPTGTRITRDILTTSADSAGCADAVLADSSVLLAGELSQSLSSFRRVLRPGGRAVLLVANWEYEMEGEAVRYELSFRRYRGKVHAGLVKRTLEPALEVEYVCVLDPDAPEVRKLAELPRDELRRLGARDVPGLEKFVVSVEVIRIPQATVHSLEVAGREAGFSRSVVGGAPGILAARVHGAAQSIGFRRTDGAADSRLAHQSSETCLGQADDVLRALAASFPFVSAGESPHLLAVFNV